MSNKYTKPAAPAPAAVETAAPTEQTQTGNTAPEVNGEQTPSGTAEPVLNPEGSETTAASSIEPAKETLEQSETAPIVPVEGTDTPAPVVAEPAPVVIPETPAPVVAPEVVTITATAAPETAPLVATTASVLTAGVTTSSLDGGLPARTVAFRDRLFAYMEDMAPGKAVEPVAGGRNQASFYNLVMAAIKDSDIKVFIGSMEVLLAAIKANQESTQVFSRRYATRFASNFSGGADQLRAWTYLWTVLHAAASPNAKEELKQIDWTTALQHLTDEHRGRVRQYFSDRA